MSWEANRIYELESKIEKLSSSQKVGSGGRVINIEAEFKVEKLWEWMKHMKEFRIPNDFYVNNTQYVAFKKLKLASEAVKLENRLLKNILVEKNILTENEVKQIESQVKDYIDSLEDNKDIARVQVEIDEYEAKEREKKEAERRAKEEEERQEREAAKRREEMARKREEAASQGFLSRFFGGKIL